ncbi:MAG: HEAT repeat domain-containing protein, partial [Planctomycetota bacterium]
MNAVLKELLGLISGKDLQLGAAAARVMGSVGKADSEATSALADTLGRADAALHQYILESLSARGGESAAATLVKFLGEPGKTGQFAAQAVASARDKAPKLLAKVIERGNAAQFRAAVEVLVSMKSKAALELLAKALFGTREMDTASFAAATVRTHLDGLDSSTRETLAKKAVSVLERKTARKGADEAPVANALKYLGALKRSSYSKMLVKFCRKGQPGEVRRAALSGLAQLKPGTVAAKQLGKVLLPMLGESDFTNVVKPALDVLWQNPLPGEYRPRLAAFLGSPYEPVKRYAVRELGRSGSAREVKDLLACLDSGDRELSERASGELRRMESAVVPLIKKLGSARDFDSARRYANILLSHKERLTGTRIKKLATRMLEFMSRSDERGRAYLWLVRATDPHMAIEKLIEAARAARKRRKFDAAERYLRLLLAGEDAPSLARYELALTLIRRGKRVMQKSAREKDDGLAELAKLVSEHELDLGRMIAGERDLDDSERFYVGFHFAERIGAERAFGGEVLRSMASGRGRTAKAARDKLAVEGLLDVKPTRTARQVSAAAVRTARRAAARTRAAARIVSPRRKSAKSSKRGSKASRKP